MNKPRPKGENARSSTVRTTITIPAVLYERAVKVIQEQGYTSFSDYVQFLIRRDTSNGLQSSVPDDTKMSHLRKAQEELRAAMAEVLKH